MSEQMWIDRAQSAESRLKTLEEAHKPALEKVKIFRKNLEDIGIKEKHNGEIDIDFDVFVENLGESNALVLRDVITSRYTVAEIKKKKRKHG